MRQSCRSRNVRVGKGELAQRGGWRSIGERLESLKQSISRWREDRRYAQLERDERQAQDRARAIEAEPGSGPVRDIGSFSGDLYDSDMPGDREQPTRRGRWRRWLGLGGGKKYKQRMTKKKTTKCKTKRKTKQRKTKKSSLKKTKKASRKTKKGKKKMNAYMRALNKARKSNSKSFVYNGKTYYQKFTKTGMAIYSSKK